MSPAAAPLPRVDTDELRISIVMPDGVRCAECVERLRGAIDSLDGVVGVVVDTHTWTLTITYDRDVVNPADLEQAARRLGLEIGETVAHASYRLKGLD